MSLFLGGTLLAGILPISDKPTRPHVFELLIALAIVMTVLLLILPTRIFVRRLSDLDVNAVDSVVANPDKGVFEVLERADLGMRRPDIDVGILPRARGRADVPMAR